MSTRAWSRPASVFAVGLLAVLLGTTSVIGADFLWLVALGDDILAHGRVPDRVPFAHAASQDWPNVLVGAEVLLAFLWRAGPTAPLVLGVVVAVGSWAALAAMAARRGAADVATALVVFVVVASSAPAWGVVRLQVLSILPFLGVLWLLDRESDRPSGRLWAVPVVLAGWGNLHGAVLVGLCVTGVYLMVSRMRSTPLLAVGVGAASVAALVANPAGLRTVTYYAGVLRNEAAATGTQLWAGLDLGRPADRLVVAALAALLMAAARQLRTWEWVAVAGLSVGAVLTARHAFWLALLLAAPAAAGLTAGWTRTAAWMGERRASLRDRAVGQAAAGRAEIPTGGPAPLVVAAGRVGTFAGVLLCVLGLVAAGTRLHPVAQVDLADAVTLRSVAGSRVVLAPSPLAEVLAVDGVRVWLADPLDAFARQDQRAYLAFLAESDEWVSAIRADLVILSSTSPMAARMVSWGFRPVTGAGVPSAWLVFERT